MSPQKWIETTNAIGIISKSGRNGGTFAHRDQEVRLVKLNKIAIQQMKLLTENTRIKLVKGGK